MTLFETSCWKDGIQVPKKYLSSPRMEVPNSAVAAAMCFLFGTLLQVSMRLMSSQGGQTIRGPFHAGTSSTCLRLCTGRGHHIIE